MPEEYDGVAEAVVADDGGNACDLDDDSDEVPDEEYTIPIGKADVKKEGPSFDLPIAVGILGASDQLLASQLDRYLLAGELALTGAVRPVKGVLPIALQARADRKEGLLVPVENASEAGVVQGLAIDPGEPWSHHILGHLEIIL